MVSDRPTEPRDGSSAPVQPSSTTGSGAQHEVDPPASPASGETTSQARTGSSIGMLLLSAVLSVACGGIGAYGYLNYIVEGKSRPGESSVASTGPAGSEKPVATSSAPDAGSDTEKDQTVKELNDRLDKLAEHVDAVEKQVKEIPHSDTDVSTDLANLQIKVADLTKSADQLTRVPKDLKRMNDHIDAMKGQVRSVRGDLDVIQSRLERSGVRVRTSVSNAATNPESVRREAAKPVADEPIASDAVLARGSDLFKSGKYKEASDLFDSLELSHPDDARVWYYAALSHGFATGNWTNGTVRLVEKGIERERAGTPKASAIDASFRDLTTATGKEWLAAYRLRAKTSDGSDEKH